MACNDCELCRLIESRLQPAFNPYKFLLLGGAFIVLLRWGMLAAEGAWR